MGYNVPDDWGNYYMNCNLCGQRYHASDGGCDCVTEECECGQCWFERRDDEIICTKCGTGPWRELSTTTSDHVAEKDLPDIRVKAGDTYRKVTTIGFFPNGKMTEEALSYSMGSDRKPFYTLTDRSDGDQ